MTPKYVDRSSYIVVNQRAIRWEGIDYSAVKYLDPTEGARIPSDRFLRQDDVVLNSTGDITIGRACLIAGPVKDHVPDSHVTMIRTDREQLAASFLVQCLRTPEFQREIYTVTSGSTGQLELGREAVAKLTIPVPPMAEQRKIAAILSAVDDAVEKRQAVIEQLRMVKQTLARQLLTRGLPNRHARFKQTEVGEIPEEWQLVRLEDVAEVERGKFSHRPRNDPRFYGGPYPFIADGLAVSRLFPRGTIVMTIAANVGETAIAEIDIAFPDSLVGITPHGIDGQFLEYFLRTRKSYLVHVATESAQKNINLQTLRPLAVPLPTREEQSEIAQVMRSVEKRETDERASMNLLKGLKTLLVRLLLTGQLRVTGAQANNQEV